MSRSSRRLGAWIALAAIALHALAPIAARATVPAPGEHEICTAAGAKAPPAGAPAPGHAAGMHCLVCPVGDRLPAIAGMPADLCAGLEAAADAPAAIFAAPAGRESLSTALSRAPPARS